MYREGKKQFKKKNNRIKIKLIKKKSADKKKTILEGRKNFTNGYRITLHTWRS